MPAPPNPDDLVQPGLTRREVQVVGPVFDFGMAMNREHGFVPATGAAEAALAKLRKTPGSKLTRREALGLERMLQIGLDSLTAIAEVGWQIEPAPDAPAARAARLKIQKAARGWTL